MVYDMKIDAAYAKELMADGWGCYQDEEGQWRLLLRW